MQQASKNLIFLLIAIVTTSQFLWATGKKDKKEQGYHFEHKIEIAATDVKDQANSGTCWSYATTSFIESELLRLGKGEFDLSEMFFVRHAYSQKAQKYIRYQGTSNFSEGGQAHDALKIVAEYGIVPEANYSGINYNLSYHNHAEMVEMMTSILKTGLKNKDEFTGKSIDLVNATLDSYLGITPDTFTYKNTEYTPKSFAESLAIIPEDYIELTSYKLYPYYEKVDLEIPDNWSHDTYYNIPLDELIMVMNHAFENGFSVNWDGDVSEKGFSHSHGIAIVPEKNPKNLNNSERLKWDELSETEKLEQWYDFSIPRTEVVVDETMRQNAFDTFKTTDDHLMHLIGTATDQNGTLYYITKNSWANDSNKYGGKLYMSESFIRLKTIAIQVHKSAIPDALKANLNL